MEAASKGSGAARGPGRMERVETDDGADGRRSWGETSTRNVQETGALEKLSQKGLEKAPLKQAEKKGNGGTGGWWNGGMGERGNGKWKKERMQTKEEDKEGGSAQDRKVAADFGRESRRKAGKLRLMRKEAVDDNQRESDACRKGRSSTDSGEAAAGEVRKGTRGKGRMGKRDENDRRGRTRLGRDWVRRERGGDWARQRCSASGASRPSIRVQPSASRGAECLGLKRRLAREKKRKGVNKGRPRRARRPHAIRARRHRSPGPHLRLLGARNASHRGGARGREGGGRRRTRPAKEVARKE